MNLRDYVISKIKEEKLIAIVRGVAPDKCLQIAQALYDGGFRLMEITFDQSAPETFRQTAEAIRAVSDAFEGRMEIGAGTVLSVELVELAAKAGAKYIISPDTIPSVIKRSRELGLVSIPGALSPTEVTTAYNCGADFIKLFPVSNLGVSYVKALRAPLSHIDMLAVGGVNEDNLKSYLDAGLCGAGIGGNLVNKAWVAAGEYEKITEAAKAYIKIVKE